MPPKPPTGGPPRTERPPAPRNDHRDAFQRGTTVSSAEDQMAKASALAEALEALRIHFEQYFLGMVRKPPTQERAAIRSAILQLKSSFIRNTAVKFRVQSLHNRYLSYERMWDRTIREMEDGTYRRDLFKARLHRARAGGVGAAAEPGRRTRAAGEAPDDFDVDEVDEELDAGADEAVGPVGTGSASSRIAASPGEPAAPPAATTSVAPPSGAGSGVKSAATATPTPGSPVAATRSPAAAPPGPGAKPATTARSPAAAPSARTPASVLPPEPPRAPGGLDDARIREIHAAYLEARRRCREATDGITVDAIAAALRKQVPDLLRKHQARAVDFQVVVKDGKAILKAFPR